MSPGFLLKVMVPVSSANLNVLISNIGMALITLLSSSIDSKCGCAAVDGDVIPDRLILPK